MSESSSIKLQTLGTATLLKTEKIAKFLRTPFAANKTSNKVKKLKPEKYSLELLLFIDSLFIETATSFLIPDFNNNILVCRRSHFIKCFKKTVLKVSVYSKRSLLETLYPDHKFLRSVPKANLSVGNCLRCTLQKRIEYVSKMSWRRVNKNSLTWWYILRTSWRYLEDALTRRFEDVLKTYWRRIEDLWLRRIYSSWSRRLEDVLWRRVTKGNIFVLIKSSWRRLEDVFWTQRRKTSSRHLAKFLSRRMFAENGQIIWSSLS